MAKKQKIPYGDGYKVIENSDERYVDKQGRLHRLDGPANGNVYYISGRDLSKFQFDTLRSMGVTKLDSKGAFKLAKGKYAIAEDGKVWICKGSGEYSLVHSEDGPSKFTTEGEYYHLNDKEYSKEEWEAKVAEKKAKKQVSPKYYYKKENAATYVYLDPGFTKPVEGLEQPFIIWDSGVKVWRTARGDQVEFLGEIYRWDTLNDFMTCGKKTLFHWRIPSPFSREFTKFGFQRNYLNGKEYYYLDKVIPDIDQYRTIYDDKIVYFTTADKNKVALIDYLESKKAVYLDSNGDLSKFITEDGIGIKNWQCIGVNSNGTIYRSGENFVEFDKNTHQIKINTLSEINCCGKIISKEDDRFTSIIPAKIIEKEGLYCRLNAPVIYPDAGWDRSAEAYYKDKECTILHRDNGPAVVTQGGSQIWYQNNKKHRIDGPAVEIYGGSTYYYLDGQRLSEDEWKEKVAHLKGAFQKVFDKDKPNERTAYYQSSGNFREDVPALIYKSGYKVWTRNGSVAYKVETPEGEVISLEIGGIGLYHFSPVSFVGFPTEHGLHKHFFDGSKEYQWLGETVTEEEFQKREKERKVIQNSGTNYEIIIYLDKNQKHQKIVWKTGASLTFQDGVPQVLTLADGRQFSGWKAQGRFDWILESNPKISICITDTLTPIISYFEEIIGELKNVIYLDGYSTRWYNTVGQLHREDGPALIHNGMETYWLDGFEFIKDQWEKKVTSQVSIPQDQIKPKYFTREDGNATFYQDAAYYDEEQQFQEIHWKSGAKCLFKDGQLETLILADGTTHTGWKKSSYDRWELEKNSSITINISGKASFFEIYKPNETHTKIYLDNTLFYYRENNELHREDGPAWRYYGQEKYYWHGKELSKEEWEKKVKDKNTEEPKKTLITTPLEEGAIPFYTILRDEGKPTERTEYYSDQNCSERLITAPAIIWKSGYKIWAKNNNYASKMETPNGNIWDRSDETGARFSVAFAESAVIDYFVKDGLRSEYLDGRKEYYWKNKLVTEDEFNQLKNEQGCTTIFDVGTPHERTVLYTSPEKTEIKSITWKCGNRCAFQNGKLNYISLKEKNDYHKYGFGSWVLQLDGSYKCGEMVANINNNKYDSISLSQDNGVIKVITLDGRVIKYIKNGGFHREDGPAVIEEGKEPEFWYQGVQYKDLDAIKERKKRLEDLAELKESCGGWIQEKEGIFYVYGNSECTIPHCETHPAIQYPDGTKEYWLNGRKCDSQEQWAEICESLKKSRELPVPPPKQNYAQTKRIARRLGALQLQKQLHKITPHSISRNVLQYFLGASTIHSTHPEVKAMGNEIRVDALANLGGDFLDAFGKELKDTLKKNEIKLEPEIIQPSIFETKVEPEVVLLTEELQERFR